MLLNDLWIRAVPVKLGGIKVTVIIELKTALLDRCKRLEMKFVRQQVDRPIIGLEFAFVGHWHFNRAIPFSPDLSQGDARQQMTLIFDQNYGLSPKDGVPIWCQFFLSRLGMPEPELHPASDSPFHSCDNSYRLLLTEA